MITPRVHSQIPIQLYLNFGYKYTRSEANNIIPYTKVDFTESDKTQFEIGSQLSLGSYLNFEIVGTQGLNLAKKAKRVFKIKGSVRW